MQKLFFISGTMCDKTLLKNLVPKLEEYEVVFLQIPDESCIEKIITALHKKINSKNINLIGFSFGGYLALKYALKYKSEINRVFIISSTGDKLSKQEIIQRQDVLNFLKQNNSFSISNKKIKNLLDKKNENNIELISLIKKMYESVGKDSFFYQINASFDRKDLSKDIKSLEKEVLFLFSKDDSYIDLDWFKKIKDFKSVSLKMINSKSHMLPLEFSKNLSQNIKKFFQ